MGSGENRGVAKNLRDRAVKQRFVELHISDGAGVAQRQRQDARQQNGRESGTNLERHGAKVLPHRALPSRMASPFEPSPRLRTLSSKGPDWVSAPTPCF